MNSRLGLSPLGPLLRGNPCAGPRGDGRRARLLPHRVGSTDDIPRIVLAVLAGGVCYIGVLVALEGKRLRDDLFSMKRLVRR